MKEEILHYIWKMKKLFSQELLLVTGEKIEIISEGQLNYSDGPDFKFAKIIINGITWVGDIEIHVKASDWYKHFHETDKKYNSVILHVVFEYDKDVFIKDSLIPTLELSNYIDKDYITKVSNFYENKTWINCENWIMITPKIILIDQINSSLIERLERKSKEINEVFEKCQDFIKVYMFLYGKLLGGKNNKSAFYDLIEMIDIKKLRQLNNVEIENIVNYISGFSSLKPFYLKGIKKIKVLNWHIKGTRPSSFPQKQIQNFIHIIDLPSSFLWHEFNVEDIYTELEKMPISNFLRNNLLINVIVPFFYWYATYANRFEFKEKALKLLSQAPKEINSITKKWLNLGLEIKSSFESQGLLEIKNELCEKNKCLNCKIGNYSLSN